MDNINLARKFVWDARQRRVIYLAMLGYLLLSGILLAVEANRVTCKIQQGLELRRQAQAVQQQFSLQYPDQSGMQAYADLLKGTLQKKSDQAAAIKAALPTTTYSVLPLLNMLSGSMQGGYISTLLFEQQGKESGKPALEFSIMVPAEVNGTGADTSTSLLQWRKNQALSREFIAIVPTTTERGNVGNKVGSILKYKAVFRED
jgi:hypothetical protein